MAVTSLPTEKEISAVHIYLSAGFGAHVCVFLFLAALAFAWLIHCKGLGLRHRLLFLPVSLLPLLAAIFFAASGAVSTTRMFRDFLRHPPPLGEPVYSVGELAAAIIPGALESMILLGISSLLFLSKNAEPGRPEAA